METPLIFGIRNLGRMEGGKGEKFSSANNSSQMDT